MNQKTVLITGGMGGLGTALCQRLHQQGYKVGVTYVHDHGREKRWIQAQKDAGFDGIECFCCDVTSWDECVKLAADVKERVGQIENLVNMAGITADAVFTKMTREQWDAVINTNLSGIFNVTKQFVAGMVERKHGRIVNISSVNAAKGQFGQTNYSAAKAGIHSFTKSLAQELVRKGITVNTVSPGYIATEMVMRIRDDVRDKIRDGIPMQRFGEPNEIAHAVSFLLDGNSGYITGSELHINGGLYMH